MRCTVPAAPRDAARGAAPAPQPPFAVRMRTGQSTWIMLHSEFNPGIRLSLQLLQSLSHGRHILLVLVLCLLRRLRHCRLTRGGALGLFEVFRIQLGHHTLHLLIRRRRLLGLEVAKQEVLPVHSALEGGASTLEANKRNKSRIPEKKKKKKKN